MTRRITIASVLITCIIACASCVTLQTTKLRSEKAKVYSLVSVGQNIHEAEGILRNAGYKLTHSTAKHMTKNKDYVQQIIQVGSVSPTASDTFFYTITGGNNPFRLESDYIVMEAGNDGVITKVE